MRAGLRRLWFAPPVIGPLLVARHVRRHRRLPRLGASAGFNDKLLRRLIFDRRPELTGLAGKLEVRAHLLARTGDPGLLIDLIGTAEDAAGLAGLDLRGAFIAKPNHLSGLTHIHRGPGAPDLPAIGAKLADWTQRSGLGEWAYQGVRRTCVVERLMLAGGAVPEDYKFFCYDGRVHFVQVDGSRFTGHRRDLFHPDWTWIDGRFCYPNADTPPPRPALLAEMCALAETLSAGLDFARVDLYAIDGGIKLGEMTMYPEGGLGWFDPPALDAQFGAPWRVTTG